MPEKQMDTRVGIYMGSFAPVHNGHINAAMLFMEQMRLDYLFILPEWSEGLGDTPTDRMKMCEDAFFGIDGVVVSDMALSGDGLLSVLKELSAKDRRLIILGGTRFALSFDQRADYKEILKLSYPVYMRNDRDQLIDNLIVNKLAKIYSETGKMFRKLQGEPVLISSADIRRRLAEGKDISSLVPNKVNKYIKEKSLYR